MFTELYAVAKHTPLQISVSPDGARLNVLIIPKPGDDADKGSALTKPIQAVGTPEELDRELPAKLAEYCAAINDLRLKIDLPIEAITAEAGKENKQKKKAAKAPHAPAPTPKKKASPKPVKPVKKAPAIKPATAANKTSAAKKDMTTASAALDNPQAEIASAQARRAEEAKAAATKQSKRATREECLADLRVWFTANAGKPITRAGFLASNTTARSYERKFKSWDEFLAEGKKAPDEWENKFPGPGAQSKTTESDVPLAKATDSRTVIDPSMKWPFPGSHEAPPAAKHISRVVYLRKDGADDKMLGTSGVPLAVGDEYVHLQLGSLRVLDVEKRVNGDERITVVAPHVAPLPDKPRLKLTADGPAPAGDTTKAGG